MTIDDFKSMTWTQAIRFCKKNVVLLATSSDEVLIQAAKAFDRKQDEEATVAMIFSELYLRDNDIGRALYAVHMMHGKVMESGKPSSAQVKAMHDLAEWMVWAWNPVNSGLSKKLKERWQFCKGMPADASKVNGIANVFLWQIHKHIDKDMPNTVMLANLGIRAYLQGILDKEATK